MGFMTGIKDKQALNNLIIELAKANDWLSRDDLRKITGKPIKTIKLYLQKDLFNFIDTKDFIELVNRNTGQGKILIEKYKLKSTPENLLAVFEYIETKKCLKKLMQTDYYKSFIPYIEKKAKEDFCFTDSDYKQFEDPRLKEYYDVGIKLSQSLVKLFLKYNSNNFESFKKIAGSQPYKLLYVVISGLLCYDIIEGMIDEEEFSKFQTSEQS